MGMPGIGTQPTSGTLGQVCGAGGGGGVRSSCRHAGTRACLSRERRTGQKMGESLSTLPFIMLPVPTCVSPASGGPAAPGSGLERPGGAVFRPRTQSRGLVSVCARCVRSAEETASLSRCSSWKPQGRPSVGLRLWHPRACGHGRSLKAPAKFFLDEKFYVCAPRFLLLLTASLLPDPRQELLRLFSASTNRLFSSRPPEGACEHPEWVPPLPHPLIGLPPPKSGAHRALHDLPRPLPALTSPLFPPSLTLFQTCGPPRNTTIYLYGSSPSTHRVPALLCVAPQVALDQGGQTLPFS